MLVQSPEPKRLLNALVAHHLAGRRVAVLEAGGGSRTVIDFNPLDLEGITTIDISAEQLDRNTYAQEKILGDLQSFTPPRRYDLVVVFNVLEHIPRADLAMENLVEACAEGGLIVVGGPCADALAGVVTRATPHRFHVLVYRHGFRYKGAGLPGYPPFPTHYHPMSQPDKLTAYLESRGFECLFLSRYESSVYRRLRSNQPIVGLPLQVLTGAINALTPKRYNTRHGDFLAIYRLKERG